MPNFTLSLATLTILALVSTFAQAAAPVEWTSMHNVERIMLACWEKCDARYQAEIYSLLAKRLESFRGKNNGYGQIGVYIEEARSGLSYGYDAHRRELNNEGDCVGFYHTASVAKLSMAYVFYHLDDRGLVSIESSHYDQVTGQRYTFGPLIHQMLTHSVNLYHNVLLRYLGRELATNTLHELGLTASTLSRELGWAPGTSSATCLERYGTLEAPRSTPADLGRLLSSLQRVSVLSPDNNQRMLHSLTHTIYNTRIPAGISYAVPVAHKTGTKDYVYNDAALVLLPNNEFVLVILTKGVPSRVQTSMRQISQDIFNYHLKRRNSGEADMVARLQEWLQQNSVGYQQRYYGK